MISNLRDEPAFAGTVADRIWNAWWREQGHELAFIRGLVDDNLTADKIPLALVAHEGATFQGTASVIESDMEERPQLSPWVAAVWVDPEHRGKGLGAALVSAAANEAFARGFDPVYLCATPENTGFYEALGWQTVEEDVGGLTVFALTKAAAASR